MHSRSTTRLIAIRRRILRYQDVGQSPRDHLSATAELMANAPADIAFLLSLVDAAAGPRDDRPIHQVRDATGQRNDTTSHAWATFVMAWWQAYGERQVSASDLLALATAGNMPLDLRGAKNAASRKIRLGRALAQRAGHIVAGFQITLTLDRHVEVSRYALTPTRSLGTCETLPLLAGLTR